MSPLRAAILLLLFATGCGKVGAPLPPVIRIPENITDLTLRQDAYNIVLMWTNPATFTDNNPVENLTAHIIQNDTEVGTIAVTGGGKPQAYTLDVRDAVGTEQTFGIRFEAERGRTPGFSNTASIVPVAVPGPVVGLNAVADQYRIRVSWQPPQTEAALAESYIVQRADQAESRIVNDNFYDDPDVESGATYTYTVRAARGTDAGIPGLPADPVTLVAMDKTPPAVPTGLAVEPDSVVAGRVFLRWEENTEADLAGYHVYRTTRDGEFVRRTTMPVQNGFFDTDYSPGMVYGVTAVDFFGNESDRSSPQPVP